MHKHKHTEHDSVISAEAVYRVCAWMFAAATLLSAADLAQHQAVVVPVGAGASTVTIDSISIARAEGRGEAARMPEVYDVGLKAPSISGL